MFINVPHLRLYLSCENYTRLDFLVLMAKMCTVRLRRSSKTTILKKTTHSKFLITNLRLFLNVFLSVSFLCVFKGRCIGLTGVFVCNNITFIIIICIFLFACLSFL